MYQGKNKETECAEKNQAKLANAKAKKGNAEPPPPTIANKEPKKTNGKPTGKVNFLRLNILFLNIILLIFN